MSGKDNTIQKKPRQNKTLRIFYDKTELMYSDIKRYHLLSMRYVVPITVYTNPTIWP